MSIALQVHHKCTNMASFEQEVLIKVLGEDKYHELLCEVGGMQLSIPRPREQTIWYLYNSGMSIKQICYRTKWTERYVRKTINKKLKQPKQ